MSTERTSSKPNPLTPIKTLFGPFCPICKKFVPLAADDIEPSAGFSKLRDKLHQDKYPDQQVTCDDPKCGHTFVATVDQIYLGGPDGTLPTRETFL
jgi:hypothetical protein